MISATAMTEARRRNQMGQPAAWTIANTAFLIVILAAWRRLYGKRSAGGKFPHCSKRVSLHRHTTWREHHM
jgi:hypothetical protein